MLDRLSINLTHVCNLNCGYCFALGGDYGGYSGDANSAAVAARIRDVVLIHSDITNVQFFGGEPLVRFDLIDHFVSLFADLHETGILKHLPSFSMVTNLTLLDARRLDAIEQHGIHVVVSLDGPAKINDVTRPYKNGRTSTRTVLANIEALRARGIGFDIECTFSKYHWAAGYSALDTIRFFEALEPRTVKMTSVSHPDPSIGFNDDVDGPRLIAEHLEALEYALDALMTKGRLVPYGFLTELIGSISATKEQGTSDKGACCGGGGAFCKAGTGNLAISADDKVYACHMFVNNDRFEIAVGKDGIMKTPNMVTKSDFDQCQSCWAAAWCVACPGAMEFQTPGHGGPSKIHCTLLREGLALVLIRLSAQA